MTAVAKGVVALGVDQAGLSSQLGKLSKMFDGFGGGAGTAFAGAFAATAAIGGILAKVGADIDEAHDSIAITTGATGAALDGFNADFANVAKNSVSSFADVGTAIGGLSQGLGLTGKPLEILTSQVTDLSRITKTDLAGNISSVTGVFNNWGVAADQQSGKLDELFRISQATGVGVGDLAAQMTTGGVAFRQAGLSFDESGALLGLLAKNGLSASDVVPALSKAMATAAKEGKPAAEVFKDTFEAIKNAPDDTAAAGDAMAVFGAKAGPKLAALVREGKLSFEDFAKTVGAGTGTIVGTAKATDDWREKLTKLGHNAAIAIEPLADKVFGALGDAISAVTPFIEGLIPVFVGVVNVVGDVFSALGTVIGWLVDNKVVLVAVGAIIASLFVPALIAWAVATWAQVAALLAQAAATLAAMAPIILIIAAIAGLVLGVKYAYQHFKIFHDVVDAVGRFFRDTLWPILQDVFGWLVDNVPPILDKVVAAVGVMWKYMQQAWDAITAIFDTAVAAVRSIIKTGVDIVTGLWTKFGGTITDTIQKVKDAITLIVTGIKDFFVGIFQLIKDVVTGKWGELWDDVKAIVTGAWEIIKGVVTLAWAVIEGFFTTAWTALSTAWQAAWDAVTGILSTAWEGIKTGVSTGVNFVVDFVTGLPKRLLDALAGLGGMLLNLGSSALGELLTGVTNGWNTLFGFVTGLPAKFLGAFTSLGSDLADLFGKAIRGLIGAIEAAWNWLANKFQFTLPEITIPMPPGIDDLHFGGQTVKLLPTLSFADGGIVPGSGAQAAIVHSGEMFLNASQQAQLFNMANGGGGNSGVVNFNGPLIGSAVIRSDDDITQLSRQLAREVARRNRGAGVLTGAPA